MSWMFTHFPGRESIDPSGKYGSFHSDRDFHGKPSAEIL